ncbi:hypothetical protein WKI68_08260 [Streptomyces sp. MS1.HAVA.3]|uniref:Uncharacterized protein n=1 Tax=Streptomyces caledonius TaxID=3134107 RepID=A0ABU8U0U9_9ACTN
MGAVDDGGDPAFPQVGEEPGEAMSRAVGELMWSSTATRVRGVSAASTVSRTASSSGRWGSRGTVVTGARRAAAATTVP